MKAIVIGACGHIGTYLVPMLVEAGYETIAISRGMKEPYEAHPAWERAIRVKMDRNNEPMFAQKIADMGADVVVDLINFRVQDTMDMVAALSESGCKHYLYCSSCWTHARAQVLPVNEDDMRCEPLCDYGKDKLASERYLTEVFRTTGFPATCVRPGQISGQHWPIIGPWGNLSVRPIQSIADGKGIKLPNFGMETIHHVHGYDVAQCFFKAITHREQALGEIFEAASGGSITLYGYAMLLFDFFGKEPDISFLPWDEWCRHEGNPAECNETYLHIARSGSYSVEKEARLIDYHPRYTNVETIRLAIRGYLERGEVTCPGI